MDIGGLLRRRRALGLGEAAEARACAYLQTQGLRLLERNYRVRGGEIDLVMQAGDGTLVFVEVRARSRATHGGAAASVHGRKQARIILAARYYLSRLSHEPDCRFDVVAVDGDALRWLPGAFAVD